MNTEHDLAAGDHVLGRDVLGLFLADQFAKGADAARERGAQALFMGAAIGRGNGVAIPRIGAVRPQRPGNRPFDAAHFLAIGAMGKFLPPGKGRTGHAFAALDLFGQMIGKAAGKLEHGLGGVSSETSAGRTSSGFRRPQRDRPWTARGGTGARA
jgi:hypothetical protein